MNCVSFIEQQITYIEPTIVYTYRAPVVHLHAMPATQMAKDMRTLPHHMQKIIAKPNNDLKGLDISIQENLLYGRTAMVSSLKSG